MRLSFFTATLYWYVMGMANGYGTHMFGLVFRQLIPLKTYDALTGILRRLILYKDPYIALGTLLSFGVGWRSYFQLLPETHQ